MNLQVLTADEGTLLWISPALPGGTHDVKAAREHDIISTCAQLDLEVLADKGYQGAGGTVITPIRRKADTEPSNKHKLSNTAHAALRAPVERTIVDDRAIPGVRDHGLPSLLGRCRRQWQGSIRTKRTGLPSSRTSSTKPPVTRPSSSRG
ncbi:transposase family protein [Streptomyces sp. SKN60]|nr:transposase family protein [Streptomyces sp. SKN60]